MDKKIAKQIYEVISRQKFFDWFGDDGDWGKHITGFDKCKTKDEILKDIEKMFEKVG